MAFKMKSAGHLVLREGSAVLLLKRFQTGWMDGNYSVPAGHLDGNESAVDAMIREAKEEIGITIKREHLRCCHIMHRRKVDGEEAIDFFFECNVWQGELYNAEPHKCNDLRWVRKEEFPANMVPYVKEAFRYIEEDKNFGLFGWPDSSAEINSSDQRAQVSDDSLEVG